MPEPLSTYENLIDWLGYKLAEEMFGGSALENIPCLLEYAEVRLPEREYSLLEDLIGY